MKHMEGSGERQSRKELTGMDRVLYENLLGNRTLPQRGPAIFAFTIEALLQDPEPKKLLAEYLFTPLNEKRAKELFDAAVVAHMKSLPPDKQPTLEIGRTRELWEFEKETVAAFLYNLLAAEKGEEFLLDEISEEQRAKVKEAIDTKELPIQDIRVFSGAIKEFLQKPETVVRLKEYRKAYKDGDFGRAEELGGDISNDCVEYAETAIAASLPQDPHTQEVMLTYLRSMR
jgi:hypothetical protein